MNGLLVTLALLAAGGAPNDANSPWHTSYGEALETARFAQQPLMVVLENPAEPSQQVSQLDAMDTSEQQLLKPFVLCRVDVSTTYGKQVAKAFKADQFPHTVVIDKTASYIIYRKTGKFSKGEWAGTLARHRDGSRFVTASQSTIYSQSATSSQPRTFSRSQGVICRT